MSFRRRLLRKKPPAGWELVEPTIEQFEEQMKEAVRTLLCAERCLTSCYFLER